MDEKTTTKVFVPSVNARMSVLGKLAKKQDGYNLQCCYTVCTRCK